MKRTFMTIVVSLSLVLAGQPALAGGGHHHGHGGYKRAHHAKHVRHDHFGHRRHHKGRRGYNEGALVAVGVGALLLGAFLGSAPRHARPVRATTCFQDEVYRTLPDGRIQTGIRTSCY